MADLNGWPLLCLVLMGLITAANYFYEKGSNQ